MRKTSSLPIKQLSWFAVVGVSAAATHFWVLFMAVRYLGVIPEWGNVVGFLVAFCVSFTGHYQLTFRTELSDNSQKALLHLLRWLLVSVGAFLLNQLLFVVGLRWFGDGYYLLIWFVVTGAVIVFSFVLGKCWAFRHSAAEDVRAPVE